MKARSVSTWIMAVASAGLGLASWPAHAQVSPANVTVGTARVIVPDGSSLKQAVGGVGQTHWFVFGVEPGKTYAVEVVDTDDDTVVNDIGTLNVYDSSGVAAPLEANVDCTMNTRAPSLEVASDGKRCVRADVPALAGEHAEQAGGVCGGRGSDGVELPDPGAGEHDLQSLDDQWLRFSCRAAEHDGGLDLRPGRAVPGVG